MKPRQVNPLVAKDCVDQRLVMEVVFPGRKKLLKIALPFKAVKLSDRLRSGVTSHVEYWTWS